MDKEDSEFPGPVSLLGTLQTHTPKEGGMVGMHQEREDYVQPHQAWPGCIRESQTQRGPGDRDT